jgi:hypothetical protein
LVLQLIDPVAEPLVADGDLPLAERKLLAEHNAQHAPGAEAAQLTV